MTMYTEYTYNDSLAHHGILGQKWGVLNGPPYPLSYQSHSRTEQKRNSASRIDGISKHNKPKSSDNRLIKENKKNSKNNIQTIKSKPSTKITSKSTSKPKVSTKPSNKSETKGKKQLTEKQKKVLKGVAIGAGVAAVAGLSAYAYHKNPAVKKAVDDFVNGMRGSKLGDITKESSDAAKKHVNDFTRGFKTSKAGKFISPEKSYIVGDKGRKIYTKFADGTENPLASKGISVQATTKKVFDSKTNTFHTVTKIADSKGLNHTIEDYAKDIEVTNIGAKGKIYGRNHNCISCAINMEMRARGFDSVAKKQPGGRYSFKTILKTLGLSTNDVRNNTYTGDSPKELINMLNNQPDGSRGIIGAPFKKSIGKNDMHFFNYVKENGELHILDGQQEVGDIDIRELFTSSTTKRSNKMYVAKGTMILRTDNANIDYDTVTEFIEPDLGTRYDISGALNAKWSKGSAYMPQSKLVKETVHGKEGYSISEKYRRIKGIYER